MANLFADQCRHSFLPSPVPMKQFLAPVRLVFLFRPVTLSAFFALVAVLPAIAGPAENFATTSEPVGRTGPNRLETPVNQRLTPAGIQVELPGMRPQALALSPDHRLLVTSGITHELVTLDPATGQ